MQPHGVERSLARTRGSLGIVHRLELDEAPPGARQRGAGAAAVPAAAAPATASRAATASGRWRNMPYPLSWRNASSITAGLRPYARHERFGALPATTAPATGMYATPACQATPPPTRIPATAPSRAKNCARRALPCGCGRVPGAGGVGGVCEKSREAEASAKYREALLAPAPRRGRGWSATQARDWGRVLQPRARDLGRVDAPGLDHGLFAGGIARKIGAMTRMKSRRSPQCGPACCSDHPGRRAESPLEIEAFRPHRRQPASPACKRYWICRVPPVGAALVSPSL